MIHSSAARAADRRATRSTARRWARLSLGKLLTFNDIYADYVTFAAEIDDGEAQALAIAKHRKLILLTDDRKATRISQRPDVAVTTITTASVLREWQERSGVGKAELRMTLERIQVLARFAPRKAKRGLW